MTLGRGLATSLAAVGAAWGIAGCGGDGAEVMRATLTDEGCTYEGDTTPSSGVFTVQVRNETRYVAHFVLWELADGAKAEEIEPWYDQALREYERTGIPKLGPPQLARPIADTVVGPGTAGRPGATSQLPAREPPGRYVVVCEVNAGGPETRPSGAAEWSGPPLHTYGAVELDVHED